MGLMLFPRYKERVLCYLLSHAVAWHSIPARIVLLSSLKKVVNRAKLQTILPLVLTAIGGKDPSIIKNETYMELLIEPFDKTVAPDLVEPGSNFWSAFIASAKIIFSNGLCLLLHEITFESDFHCRDSAATENIATAIIRRPFRRPYTAIASGDMCFASSMCRCNGLSSSLFS